MEQPRYSTSRFTGSAGATYFNFSPRRGHTKIGIAHRSRRRRDRAEQVNDASQQSSRRGGDALCAWRDRGRRGRGCRSASCGRTGLAAIIWADPGVTGGGVELLDGGISEYGGGGLGELYQLLGNRKRLALFHDRSV
jgi:hypothetical protein